MIPLAIFAGAAAFIKVKNLSIHIDELLEVEQAYCRLLEEKETGPDSLATQSKSRNIF